MKFLLFLIAFVGLTSATLIDDILKRVPKLGKEVIDAINKDDKIPFMARHYDRFVGKTIDQLKESLGALPDPEIEKVKEQRRRQRHRRQSGFSTAAPGDLPVNFTVSENWANCASVFNIIQDQSNCGSCWAVSTASVLQDRRCIAHGGPQQNMSSWDLVSCCSACQGTKGNGCLGGYTTQAFNYFVNSGVVTGGRYGSNEGCKPYPVSPSASSQPTSTACSASCRSGYSTSYSADKKKGQNYQIFSNQNEEVMQEIYNNGPVVASYKVYQDFMVYSSGIYRYSGGNFISGHAVRVVGWGQANDGTLFWRVANSWGTGWGEKGYFNIVRGTDEVDFESGIVAGIAL